jgi:hypothetical protein
MERVDLHNNQIWARLTIALLWLQMFYSLVAIFIYYSLYSLIAQQSIGFGYSQPHHILESKLLEMEFPLSILTILFFLIWFWRTYANFHVLHFEKAKFDKIWAIVGWFLPFLNFYIPFAIMREIWLENQDDDEDFVNEKRYRWVIWWWAFFLMQFVFPVITTILYKNATEGIATLKMVYFTFICKYFFIMVSAGLAIMLVFKINQSEQKLRKEQKGLDIYDHLVR